MLQLAVDHLVGGPRDEIDPTGATGAALADPTRLGEVILRPHQREGARRLQRALAAHGGALLADEVGTGKTFTALAVARSYAGLRIVAPASLRATWELACRRAGVRQAEFISFERLSAGYIPSAPPPPLLLLDEAHHARNPGTRRYRTLAALARGVHVLLLSATPVHNRRRDLDALLALFLGASASQLDGATLATLVVRRDRADAGHAIPALRDGVRHEVAEAPEVLARLRALPPPVPPRDGGVAQALVALQLTRAWCSSDAALLAAIRRRLVTAAALEEALREGRHPARHDLALWTGGDDGSVQLAFPALCAPPLPVDVSANALLAALEAHAAALRELRALVRGARARDAARFAALARIVSMPGATPAIVFTHSAETAGAAFAALRELRPTALLTGRGAWLASGSVPRRELLAAFAPGGGGPLAASPATALDVLVATDVVSEGVDLQRAATIVHLDLPWTAARMEQRVGRVRRIGSRHTAVTVHVIAPPAGAAELAETLRVLARKEALAMHAVGPSSMLGATPPWRAGSPGAGPAAPGHARQQLIERLRELHQLARASSRTPRERDVHVQRGRRVAARPGPSPPARSSSEGAVRGVAYWHLPNAPRTMVLAPIDLDGEPQLLAGDGRTLTTDPEHVLRQVEQLLSLARVECPHACGANAAAPVAAAGTVAPHSAGALVKAVKDWSARRRAGRLLALPFAQRSPTHRRLLLALDAVHSALPRAVRPRAAARAAQARALVLAQHGAGAEALLHRLAAAAPAPLEGAAAAERWLGEVIRALQPDDASALAQPASAGDEGKKRHGAAAPPRDYPAAIEEADFGVRVVALLVVGPDPPR